MLYHKFSLSSSVACMSVTRNPGLSLSVTSTILSAVLIFGGNDDFCNIGITTIFSLAVWLFLGEPKSSALIINSYSASGSNGFTT